jgi:hypothetical protein
MTGTLIYPVGDPRAAAPRCVLCAGPALSGVSLPYGSRYDGARLCTACLSALLDPLLERVRRARGERDPCSEP